VNFWHKKQSNSTTNVSRTDINGDTALHWAAYKGHAEIIQILINSGVDLQKTDNFGSTPLHLSCLSGNLQCVRLLCQKRNLDLCEFSKNRKS
jgi:palmitoyltransferase ZDHHC13/17